MTDEELIARLREGCSCNINKTPCWAETVCRDYFAAADRIEAQAAEIERLRGDLAKAVEALERVSNSQPRPKRNGDYDRSDVSALQRIARTAIAELTGDKT